MHWTAWWGYDGRWGALPVLEGVHEGVLVADMESEARGQLLQGSHKGQHCPKSNTALIFFFSNGSGHWQHPAELPPHLWLASKSHFVLFFAVFRNFYLIWLSNSWTRWLDHFQCATMPSWGSCGNWTFIYIFVLYSSNILFLGNDFRGMHLSRPCIAPHGSHPPLAWWLFFHEYFGTLCIFYQTHIGFTRAYQFQSRYVVHVPWVSFLP